MHDGTGECRAEYTRYGAYSVGDAHQNGGILGGHVQVIHAEPDGVAKNLSRIVLDMPIKMAAYLGATSRWFTPNLIEKKTRKYGAKDVYQNGGILGGHVQVIHAEPD
jgi:hypothetical protein